jgi:hypothetical protein
MKNTIIIAMMFFVLSTEAQQKREYFNDIDTVVTISGNVYMHYWEHTKKVYKQKRTTTLEQVSIKIAGLVQDSMNCKDAITPLKTQYLTIKNNAELDSASRDNRLNRLRQRYDLIQDELDDIELRKIQEQKLFDGF